MAFLLPLSRSILCCLLLLTAPSLVWSQDLLNTDKVKDLIQSGLSQESETSTAAPEPAINRQQLLFEGATPTSIEELRFLQDHFAELAEKIKPAVVNIQIGGAQGSGVVITEDGYILTAAHVIGRPNEEADITFMDEKRTKVKAVTLGIERRIDSGMLKIKEGQGDEFPYLDIGLSEELKEGQWVLAIGHPGGIDEARGLVVRIGRIIYKNNRFLRTDCTLVGGDSGGPLIDMNGEVVGIHSRIGQELWNNLHVPIDTYSENWDRLTEGIILDGKAGLKFAVVQETNEVEDVEKGGPADKAGLKKGDIILKIGGRKTEDKEDIGDAIERLRPNMKTKIVVSRDGEEQTLEAIVGEWGTR